MRVQWKALRKRIPTKVHIGKTPYEIVWIEAFHDGVTVGETRYEQRQIVLKTGENDKETVLTYCHEILHAWSHESGADLTETQVAAMEELIPILIKTGNIFTYEKTK
jgi:Zn-dependent peptidase ImmA (M78 family)